MEETLKPGASVSLVARAHDEALTFLEAIGLYEKR